MKIWITTDTHLGHDKLVEYSERPADFSKKIILNHMKTVSHNDVLIHLGDFCIGDDVKWHEEFMRISCRKWLVRGNHDSKSDSFYLDHGWDFISESILMNKFGFRILFSHAPSKYIDFFDYNIHGHLHNNAHRLDDETKSIITEKHLLLAIEQTNYFPVSLEKFLK